MSILIGVAAIVALVYVGKRVMVESRRLDRVYAGACMDVRVTEARDLDREARNRKAFIERLVIDSE